MTAHDRFDGFGCLVSVVEGDGADVVVKDVGFNDTMEESAADKTKLAIDCRSGSTDIVPAFGRVMGKGGISVLKVGDCNWMSLASGRFQILHG
jgi:hypothetical protein